MNIGNIITERRVQLGLTQKEVAKATGCSTSTIQSIEQGRRKPSMVAFEKICDFLKLGIEIRIIK